MTNPADTSRRAVLRILSGAPLIPVVGFAIPEILGANAVAAANAPKTAEFIGMAAPDAAAAQATTTVESSLAVTYADGKKQTFKLAYQALFLTGDQVPDGNGGTTLAGGYYDIAGKPILDAAATPPTQFFSDCPDGYSLLQLPNASVPGVTGSPLFAVVQFEYTTFDAKDTKMYGQLPSPIAVLTLDQDKTTGALKLVKYHTVDTSKVHGLWITCGASLSPWNTHLSSEEFEPDAAAEKNPRLQAFSRHLYGDPTKANPYHYGHIPEIVVNADGTGTVKKHYCLGRISHELVQVMPDQRTVIMGDDFTNGGFFMFIADKPADLSAGTLYVAKVTQQVGVALGQGGAFDLQWVKLGHATSAEIEQLANTLKAADIVDVKTADPNDAAYTAIHYDGKKQWVKFKPGVEKAAAFLETHRWAPLAGGTLGFSKMEGVALNAKDRIAYLAMSYINKSMSDGTGDGIKVSKIEAGATYQLPLKPAQRDSSGAAIESEWVPVQMSAIPALVGKDLEAPDALGNTADAEHVANPDNLKFSERLRTLFVGEDSNTHVNNFIWAYNVDTGKLTRILSCPAGAEATGLQAVDDLNGFMYIMSNFQHAGDWDKGLHDKVKPSVAPLIDKQYRNRRAAAVGYIHGLPRTT